MAYPELADNPIHRISPALNELINEVWDEGNQFFPPTRLQISNFNSGAGAENIIPANANVQFNLRFSTELTDDIIKQRTHAILDRYGLKYELVWRLSGHPFLTQNGALIDATHRVIELGALNASIHKVNEHIGVEDVEILSQIYEQILVNLLSTEK